jgi:hypothetical protein
MAVPDSLTSWREFVDRQPVEPRRMTMKQISALSPDEKAAHDLVPDTAGTVSSDRARSTARR